MTAHVRAARRLLLALAAIAGHGRAALDWIGAEVLALALTIDARKAAPPEPTVRVGQVWESVDYPGREPHHGPPAGPCVVVNSNDSAESPGSWLMRRLVAGPRTRQRVGSACYMHKAARLRGRWVLRAETEAEWRATIGDCDGCGAEAGDRCDKRCPRRLAREQAFRAAVAPAATKPTVHAAGRTGCGS